MLLRHINYLLAVAEHGNFTRAAEALHVSQPTLSQQIRQLEEQLGAVLLDRSGRAVRTTAAGDAYIVCARRALRDLEAGRRAIHDVQDLSRGTLRLAFTPTFSSYLVGPLVERFGASHPGLTLAVSEMAQERMQAALADDRVDLGIAFAGAPADDIDCQPLFQERLGAVLGAGHALAGAARLTPWQLRDEPLALLSADFATRIHIDAYFREHGVAPRIAIEANSIGAIVEIARRGRVATILPLAIARVHPALLAVALEPAPAPRMVALLARKGAYRSAAAQAFAALAHSLADEAGRAALLGLAPPVA
ncbi:transcriptional regulator CynR [Janthinobacterium fluminis]|uniref:Transcriptional regulator CynR n=1 Tax=Janthinobacterium fluminis TaxID=2987524 RepID=A0ABT5JZM1_9BURK|nr:transcriptional regulator CynR [Janthinobacterium fluminis]MDC8758169.1 transcriptional regulator CynR [Janthinobacterium fluminis]